LFYVVFVRSTAPLLLDLMFCSSCSIWCSFCSTCYSTPFVRHALLFLLDLLLCSSCSTSLLRYLSITLMILLVLAPFVQPCFSAPFVFFWFFPPRPPPPPPPFCKCGMWRSYPNLTISNSSCLSQTWKVSFFVQFLFVDEFF
jgi:hypothetical protein